VETGGTMVQTPTAREQQTEYIWGRGQDELERLIAQGRILGDSTEHLLRRAGIEPGMRVLDIGSGAGDVAFLVARLVGPEGTVIGVDSSAEATAGARGRARQAGVANVEFVTCDAADLTLDAPVDAIVGRLVLVFFDDATEMLSRLLRNVRPGGIVAFQEWASFTPISHPRCPLFESVLAQMAETFVRAGYGERTGLRMRRVFLDAGIKDPRMLVESCVEGGPESSLYAALEQMVRKLLPAMQRLGVTSAEEIGIDTLAARLREEAVAQDAVLALPPLVGAWGRNKAD
jgi:ubiquinone/menaquinone biosynthesis C-methylase UbiE